MKSTQYNNLKNQPTFTASVLLLSVAILFCGCAGVSVRGSWQDGVPHNLTFSRVLVVGVTADRDLRCDFESTFISQLSSASTTAISSCSAMGPGEPLNRQTVERAVASVHADAVLATSLVSASDHKGVGGSNDTRGGAMYKATDFGYGAYGMPVTEVELQTAKPLTSITSSIHVVTKVYETKGATLLYTIDTQTKAQEINSTQATLLQITAPTADRLRREGLIH